MKKILASLLILAIVSSIMVYTSRPAQAAWFDADWTLRVKVEINPSFIDSTLTDFPVYIAMSDLEAAGDVIDSINGCDWIRVTTDDGITQVPVELVDCTPVGNTGEMYFKAPTISSSATTTFYVYYENPAASVPADSSTYGRNNVWTNNYGGVWHMGGGTLEDSSGQVADSTTNSGTASTDILTEGSATDFSGSSQQVIIPDDTDIDEDVLSSLTYWTATKADAWNRSLEKSNQYFLLNFAGAGSNGPLLKLNAANIVADIGAPSTGTYHMTGGSYSFSGGSTGVVGAILNGSTVDTTTGQSFAIDGGGGDLYVGSDDAGAYFNGRVDELRISKEVRSEAWLGATWDNMNNPDAFYFVDTEEVFSSDFPIATSPTETAFPTSVTSMAVDLPASIVSGDLLIALVEVRSGGVWTLPSDWVELGNQAGGVGVGELTAFYKIADGSEAANATWSTTVVTTGIWQVYKVTNWHGTTPPELTSASGDISDADPPSLTPSWGSDNTLWLSVAGHAAVSSAAFTAAPTNYTDFESTGASSGGAAVSLATARRENVVASEDPDTFTGGGSNRYWAAMNIAVRSSSESAPVIVEPQLYINNGRLKVDNGTIIID